MSILLQRDHIRNVTKVVSMEAIRHEIQLRDAKATLSAVVDHACAGKPAIITRHGKPTAVMLSYAEEERLSRMPSFGRLLMSAPLDEADFPERVESGLREVEF